MDTRLESATAEHVEPSLWNYKQLLLAFFVGLVLQMILLPSLLCSEAMAMVVLAWVFDALVLVRAFIAWVRKERGRGWVFYTVLLYTSPVWIVWVISLLAGR